MQHSERRLAGLAQGVVLVLACSVVAGPLPAGDNLTAVLSVTGMGVFLENDGQWEDGSLYRWRGPGVAVAVLPDRLVFVPVVGRVSDGTGRWSSPVTLRFEGASESPGAEGLEPAPGVYRSLVGDRTRWRTDIHGYRRVKVTGLYPGVDLVYGVSDDGITFDIEAESVDALGLVRLRVEGADNLSADATLDTELVATTDVGQLRWAMSGTAVVRDPSGSFGFGPPDGREGPITIRQGLEWSGYLGGQGGETVEALAIAPDGGVIVTGVTVLSPDFPTTPGAFDTEWGGEGGGGLGANDAFVARLSADGTTLEWSTFLGGNSKDCASALLCEPGGQILVAGETNSSDFPTTLGVFQPALLKLDCFIARLTDDGTDVLMGTYLGGDTDVDAIQSMALVPDGSIVVAGRTQSTDFPVTPTALQPTLSGPSDMFVSHLSADGSTLLASTLFGGSGSEFAADVDVSSTGRVLLGFQTGSLDLPVPDGAFQRVHAGARDGFLACLDLSLSTVHAATYIGGQDWDQVTAVAFHPGGGVVATGYIDFPGIAFTEGAFDPTHNGDEDVFVARFTDDLSEMLWGTYVGGLRRDFPQDMVVESSGAVVVAGDMDSPTWPTTQGSAQPESQSPAKDEAFVFRLSPEGDALFYSTLLGGPLKDGALAVAVDALGAAVIGGRSDGLPVTEGAWETELSGPNDAFVARLTMLPVGAETYGASTPGCAGPLAVGVTAMPAVAVPLELTCTNAPPLGSGWLVVGLSPLASPVSRVGTDLWVLPGAGLPLLPVVADGLGFVRVPVQVPPQPSLAGAGAAVQFVFPDGCAPAGLSASNGLKLLLQP